MDGLVTSWRKVSRRSGPAMKAVAEHGGAVEAVLPYMKGAARLNPTAKP